MWLVQSAFGHTATHPSHPETERLLGTGETYPISRQQVTGRELYFSLRQISRAHAFLEVGRWEGAPEGGSREGGATGRGTTVPTLSVDWRPRLRLMPGQRRVEKPLQVFRLKRASDQRRDADTATSTAGGGEEDRETLDVPLDEPFDLEDGDIVSLMAGRNVDLFLRVKWFPLAFCVMSKTAASKELADLAKLTKEAASVGIPIVVSQEWTPGATHLVLKRVALRPIVIDALHAPAPLVNISYLRDVIHTAIDAEASASEFTPKLAALDPTANLKYGPDTPFVAEDESTQAAEQMRARLREAVQVKERSRPLVGRTVLCFVSDDATAVAEGEAHNVAKCLESLGAKVRVHSLTRHPLRSKSEALKVLSEVAEAASLNVLQAPHAVRRHIETHQPLIIYYMGDEASLEAVGTAALEKGDLPMPKTTGGELDWVAYGVRTWQALLATYSGKIDDYIERLPPSQAVVDERQQQPPPPALAGAEAGASAPAEGSSQQPPEDEGVAATQREGEEGDLSVELMSFRRLKQSAESRKRSLLEAFLADDEPPRPAVRSKGSVSRAGEAAQAHAQPGSEAESRGTTSGSSSSKAPSRRKIDLLNLDDVDDDLDAGAGSTNRLGSRAASRQHSVPESMARRLRAQLEEEARSQAVEGGSVAAGRSNESDSLFTQAEQGGQENDAAASVEPSTPLVDMGGSFGEEGEVEERQGRRKRTASVSPARVARETTERVPKRRRGDPSPVSPPAEHGSDDDGGTQARTSQAPTSQSRVVRGHRHNHTGRGPDRDERFLQAVSTIERRKKGDSFDKEFNQLRIAKPVYDSAGQRASGPARGGGKRNGADGNAIDEDEEDEEFSRFKEMADDDFDCNLRGNFMQVDIVPLVVDNSRLVRHGRVRADGRPDFKAFRKRGHPVYDPSRVVRTVLDPLPQLQIEDDTMAVDAQPQRTTYSGKADEAIDEDDADFAGLHPPTRTFSGSRAKSKSKFNFSLGDPDKSAGGEDALQLEEPSSRRGRGRSQGSARTPAGRTETARSQGRGRAAATQYVEVEDDDEDSDPEAALLLNLDEEDARAEAEAVARGDSQFSLDSYRGGGGGGPSKSRASGRRAPPTKKKTTTERVMEAVAAASSPSVAKGQHGPELFQGIEDSLDPLAEQAGTSLDANAGANIDTQPGPGPGSGSTVSVPPPRPTLVSSMGPPGSVVPASRPMDSHDEDTFMGFGGASGRRKRGTAPTSSSATSRSSGRNARSRF